MPTQKQSRKGKTKAARRRLELRDHLWPDASDQIWDRNSRDGWTTIPRTMPLIGRIVDSVGPKGKPASGTYFALWARVFDESIIDIGSAEQIAFESGFGGQRAVTTWSDRMATLEELGFIRTSEGPKGKRQYVLLLDPYKQIKDLNDQGKIPKSLYTAFFVRAGEIGAGNDLQ